MSRRVIPTSSSNVPALQRQTANAVNATVRTLAGLVVSVKDYGAKGDGVTDDYNAITAALTFAGAQTNGGVVFVPTGTYYVGTGLVVPNKVVLVGAGMLPMLTPVGTVLKFANSVTSCVKLGSGSNQTAGLRDLAVYRTGTPPAGSIGVECNQVTNIVISNVFSANHGKCFYFKAVNVYGIAATMDVCFTAQALEDHIYIDSWPELKIIGGRYGINGAYDYDCTSYVRILGTDTSGSGGIGPNTITVIGAHFNQGGGTAPDYFVFLDDIGVAVGNQVEFNFIGCHVESVGVAGIKSDATSTYFQRVFIGTGTVFNAPSVPFLALDAATSVGQFEVNGAKLYCSTFVLSQSADNGVVSIIGGEISGTATITGATSAPTTLAINGTFFSNGLTLAGKFSSAVVSCPSNITNSATPYAANSNISIQSYNLSTTLKPLHFTPGTSVTTLGNGDVAFELTNNTTLTIRARGSDGTARSATVTLA